MKSTRNKTTNIAFPSNWENSYLIFYNFNSESVKEVLYFKSITEATNKSGAALGFYGVKASAYGIRVPANATHWCLAILGGSAPIIIMEHPIADSMTQNEYPLNQDVSVFFNRYSKNVKFMIGSSNYSRSKTKVKDLPNYDIINNLLNQES